MLTVPYVADSASGPKIRKIEIRVCPTAAEGVDVKKV